MFTSLNHVNRALSAYCIEIGDTENSKTLLSQENHKQAKGSNFYVHTCADYNSILKKTLSIRRKVPIFMRYLLKCCLVDLTLITGID